MKEYALSVYNALTWTVDDIEIVIDGDATDDPVVTASILFPDGELQVMAEARTEAEGRRLVLEGLHTHGSGGPGALGVKGLRLILQLAMEKLDVDEILVRGAVRTTGANPGRRPGDQRFARRP